MRFTTLCGEPWLNRIEQYTILKEISSAYNLRNFGSKARPTLNTGSYSPYYLLEVDGLFNQCREDFSLYFFEETSKEFLFFLYTIERFLRIQIML